MPLLRMEGRQFLLDEQPLSLLSGAIHYFRVVPEYWQDRLLKLKAAGLNTVETYVAWNIHEPQPGQFDYAGIKDLEAFIALAGELGLHVLLRPGPYICSEWDMGGLPAWLLKTEGLKLRCAEPQYLAAVDRFFDDLIPRLLPLLSTQGGPILAVQVENEYGSYGNDTQYLVHLAEGMRRRGIDVPLFTSDGGTDWMLQGGTLPDVFKTVNFGSRPQENFAKLLEYQPDQPLMCMEFWNGWFDHWGEEHHTRPVAEVAETVEAMLQQGASINFYMFHGGTNFGFYNGANCFEQYEPTISSYDSDAPISEAGELTEKYHAIRAVLAKYGHGSDLDVPEAVPKCNYGTVPLTEAALLRDSLVRLAEPVVGPVPLPMEMLDQNYGYIVYRTAISGPREEAPLRIYGLRDRAHVFLNGNFQGILERNMSPAEIALTIPDAGGRLEILVENMGRSNYGAHLADRKGILEGVQLAGQFLFGWTMFPLPLQNFDRLIWQSQLPESSTQPAFYRGSFAVEVIGDTFLYIPHGTKGTAWINGFHLGRYWNSQGPQQTLYVPGPILKQGTNQLVLFETDGLAKAEAELRQTSILADNPNRKEQTADPA